MRVRTSFPHSGDSSTTLLKGNSVLSVVPLKMQNPFLFLCTWSIYLVIVASIGEATDLALSLLSPTTILDQKAFCVSGEQWPEWSGTITLASCADAIKAMVARVPDTQHPWFFWTGAKNDEPRVPWPWHLPKYTDSGEFDSFHTAK